MRFNFSPAGFLAVQHLKFAPMWLAAGFFLIAFIGFLSVISVPVQVKAFMFNDKLMHVAVYGCLMGWFAQIFRHDLTRLVLASLFVLFGVAMEYVQSTVPARHFEYLDMMANTCGILLAWALAYTWMGSLLEWFERTFLSWFPQPVNA